MRPAGSMPMVSPGSQDDGSREPVNRKALLLVAPLKDKKIVQPSSRLWILATYRAPTSVHDAHGDIDPWRLEHHRTIKGETT